MARSTRRAELVRCGRCGGRGFCSCTPDGVEAYRRASAAAYISRVEVEANGFEERERGRGALVNAVALAEVSWQARM